ncbi:MAG: hypothetical protein V4478_03810 [Patescibacteria group bacterium]
MDTSLQSTVYPESAISLDGGATVVQNVGDTVFSAGLLNFLFVIMTLLLIALITLTIYLLVRLYEIRMDKARLKKPTVIPGAMPSSVQASVNDVALPVENATWRGIRERLLGDNPSEWKLSIIEADIYMDRVLDDKGFHGDTTGDKLKQITPDRLPSIQIAWEVHKIRNRIAHDGAAFVLTMPEARRLLSYYEIVFTDLGVL